ncbi:MAG: DinB family protein [Acidobacteria bacterium]|nr:DinB family protein [Acidobacteriota bacterium]
MDRLAPLAAQIDEIGALLDDCPLDLRAPRVSGWSVGEQVDHMTQVLASGLGLLETPGEPRPNGINLSGRILLALRWIPRGVGKSPKGVLPRGASPEDLRERLADLRRRLDAISAAPDRLADPRPTIPHPYFGALNPAQGLRFLAIHTRHHLKIVRDIRKASSRP